MRISHIQSILKSHFQTVNSARPNVFKATHSSEGRVVGLYFFDLTEEIFLQSFDLKTYQDALLADDYYRASGSLQWNFYLYFICEEEKYKRLRNTPALTEIETDKAFARKYVTTEKLLERELPGTLQRSKTETARPDISLRWIEKLKAEQLDAVYMKAIPRTKAVDSYLNGKPIAEQEKGEKQPAFQGKIQLSNIKQLKIDGYRKYPELKDFEFGICNLIEGANGSGKTSLLEAIELWTCGQNFRDPKHADSGRIGLGFQDGKAVEWDSRTRSGLFRQRDWAWYGNHYPKGNKLCLGFNRFNFYNTDAAVRLEASNIDEEKTVWDALSDLVLGETATMIDERAKSILTLFTQEQKVCSKLILLHATEIKEAKEELETLGPTKQKEASILEKFVSQLKRFGWLKPLPTTAETSLDGFAEEFTQVQARLRRNREDISWLTDFDVRQVEKESIILSNLLKKIEVANKKINEGMSASSTAEEIASTVERQLALMREYQPYIHNVESPKLRRLEESIREAQETRQLYESAQAELADVYLDSYANTGGSLSAFEKKLRREIDALSLKIRTLADLVRSTQDNADRITKLVAGIRVGVSELLAHSHNITECPVCGARYEIGELKSLLLDAEARSDQGGENKFLRERVEELNKGQGDLDLLNKQLEDLRRMKNAHQMVEGPKPNITVKGLVGKLLGLSKDASAAIEKVDELTSMKTRLLGEGLVQEQYESLFNRLKELDKKLPLEPLESDRYEEFLRRKEQEQFALSKKAQTLKAAISGQIEAKENLLRSYFEKFAPKDLEAELRKRESVTASVLRTLEADCTRFQKGSTLSITELLLQVDRIQTAYEEFLKAKKNLQESAHIRERNQRKIERATKELERASQRNERAGRAIATLESILTTDSKEKHLNAFLRENTCEIAETFRLIHSPREFESIEFDVDDDRKIVLVKEGSKTKLSITKISSGQRAALALSLFLTLNRKLMNGPPFLIFDDPVAHIDDLNVLSFFDYLRETMLNLKRQVFFATANEKVAYLFRKKFDFLGEEDFRSYRLARN